jgi:hypothetical protein
MKAILIILITMLIPIIVACKKDKQDDIITISGITERNEFANPIGNVDDSDWRFHDVWPPYIENIFKQDSAELLKPTDQSPPDWLAMVSCYPNPVTEGIMYLSFPSTMFSDVRVVDSNLNIYYEHDYQKYNIIAFDGSYFKKNKLYRVYYKLYQEDKVYRGHGDFYMK